MKRWLTQIGWALLTNLHLSGFVTGRIYQGPLKRFCVPGLNCHSCPGALGACPIGALQAVIGSAKHQISLYAAGFLTLFGVGLGRFICGWLCPFGLVQDALHRIRSKKPRVPPELDRPLRFLKYVVLLAMVIMLPMLTGGSLGAAPPYFCEFLCPSGTLFGGIPLLLANPGLRQAVGLLFSWKALVLAAVLAGSVLLYRPFCKYLCPLGAVYAMFNRVSLIRLQVDGEKCAGCGACERACKMRVPVRTRPNHGECIRCGGCGSACPNAAIRYSSPLGAGKRRFGTTNSRAGSQPMPRTRSRSGDADAGHRHTTIG